MVLQDGVRACTGGGRVGGGGHYFFLWQSSCQSQASVVASHSPWTVNGVAMQQSWLTVADAWRSFAGNVRK
eukprot:10422756-Prorocentrum_lima.AAC.1